MVEPVFAPEGQLRVARPHGKEILFTRRPASTRGTTRSWWPRWGASLAGGSPNRKGDVVLQGLQGLFGGARDFLPITDQKGSLRGLGRCAGLARTPKREPRHAVTRHGRMRPFRRAGVALASSNPPPVRRSLSPSFRRRAFLWASFRGASAGMARKGRSHSASNSRKVANPWPHPGFTLVGRGGTAPGTAPSNGMKPVAFLLQPYRICGRTVYVYKRPRGGLPRLGWGFWLAGREPVEGFRTRKAALEHARKGLAA
jgi:hypothetical protein